MVTVVTAPLLDSLPAQRGRPRDPRCGRAILVAARALLAERGFTGTSMEAIAHSAGVGKDTLYRRWDSKEQLVEHLLTMIADEGIPQRAPDDDPRIGLFVFLQDVVRLNTESDFGAIVAGVVGESARNPKLASGFPRVLGRPPPVRLRLRPRDRRRRRAGARDRTDRRPGGRADLLPPAAFWPHDHRRVPVEPRPDRSLGRPRILIRLRTSVHVLIPNPKESPMQLRQHLLAVVEPNEADDASLDMAADLVARGGKATVLMLLNQQARDDFRRFADSEDLLAHVGEAMALERLTNGYTSRIGGEDTEVLVAIWTSPVRELLEVAAELRATSIVIPQRLAARRSLRRLVSDTTLPVLIAPAA